MKVNDFVENFPFLIDKFDPTIGSFLDPKELEESYFILWTNLDTSKLIELPTGGSSVMRNGENCCCFARKEQCLAIAKMLRVKFKVTDYRIYRTFFSEEIQHLHPQDGISPEKVNVGRETIGVDHIYKV